MAPIPFLRVFTLVPFVTFLDRIGSPTEKYLQQCNLPVLALNNLNTLLPRHQSFMFIEKTARKEGIANLGLLVGQQTPLIEFGAFGRIVSQSFTLYDAMIAVISLSSIFNSGERYSLIERKEQAWFCQEYTMLGSDPYDAVHFSLMLIVELIQKAAGTQWRPTEIHLQSRQAQVLSGIELFSEVQIYTEQATTAVAFPRSFLSLPLKSPGNLCAWQCQQDYEILQSSAPAMDFSASIRQAISTLLQDGYPDVHLASEIAGMSVRTFQRRLAQEGCTYSRLVEQARFDEAIRWLQDPSFKLVDIATELGYSDAAHFTRAFKRWTGVSPREFRRQKQEI